MVIRPPLIINKDLLLKKNYIDKDGKEPPDAYLLNAERLVFNKEGLINDKIMLINNDLIKDAEAQMKIFKNLKSGARLY